MIGHQIEGEGGLIVVVEVGPVHGDDDLRARADHMRHPAGEALPDIDALVAEQAVNLLNRVLGDQAARLGEGLADHRHRQRCAGHDTERGTGQGVDALGVQVVAVEAVNERTDVLQPSASPQRRCLHATLESTTPPVW
jgi:hypothetical protein